MKKQLDEMRAIDDGRFEIRLKKAFPHLLYGLGRAVDCVIRPERVGGHVDAFSDAKDYTGSGPYEFLRCAGRRIRHLRPVQFAT
jgi:peptide/nickel transport system substrate-binding protein